LGTGFWGAALSLPDLTGGQTAGEIAGDESLEVLSKSTIRTALLRRVAASFGFMLLSLAVVLVLWEGFIGIYHIQPEIAKSPPAVWRYLFTQHADAAANLRSAAGNRSVLLNHLLVTLRDAGIGYLAGIVLGLSVACVFVMQGAVRQTFLPIALVLRAMPLVALAPLLTLIFGRGLVCVGVIGGIVCFFPALINIMHGLRSTPSAMVDLMSSYGVSKLKTLRTVIIPSALPSIFASLRINVPASMIGALLAEWLATGQGSGQEMLTVENTFDFGELWSAVVLVTLVTIIAYSIVSAVEAGVLSRYAPDSIGKRPA
jgi:ABC-type nitrate/sulfonate/bicarbonate transport system permease component